MPLVRPHTLSCTPVRKKYHLDHDVWGLTKRSVPPGWLDRSFLRSTICRSSPTCRRVVRCDLPQVSERARPSFVGLGVRRLCCDHCWLWVRLVSRLSSGCSMRGRSIVCGSDRVLKPAVPSVQLL
eukprot:3272079-Rhodomonas_salina.3